MATKQELFAIGVKAKHLLGKYKERRANRSL